MRAETIAILNLVDSLPMGRRGFFQDIALMLVEEKFYTAEAVAERYSVTEQTVRNWAKDNKLVPSIKVGNGCLRYSASDLAEFEKNNPGRG